MASAPPGSVDLAGSTSTSLRADPAEFFLEIFFPVG